MKDLPPKRAISLVSTVLNDRVGCIKFFEQMALQVQPPDEIVLVDGGSHDGTWQFLQQAQTQTAPWRLQVHQEHGCNVARGRNLAIERASHELIASTDIGCHWDAEWLAELSAPFWTNPECQVVLGSWMVRAEDLTSTWARVEYSLLREPRLIARPESDASSRSIAYTRTLWKEVGGYPEDLTLAADDMVFSLLLHRRKTRHIASAPAVRCYWMRPETFRAFCKEARRNFLGAGEAGLWLSYGLRVGGRLAAEIILVLSGLILAASGNLLPAVIALILASASIGMRLARLRPSVIIARHLQVDRPWARLVAFEYATKVYSLLGYWRGLLRGNTMCRDCRTRLRQARI